MHGNRTIEIFLQVSIEKCDIEELSNQTYELRRELLEFEDVKRVDLINEESTLQGTKAADLTLLGALLVVAIPIVLEKLLEFIHSWSMRGEGRTVKISVQTSKGDSINVEAPTSMKQDEVKKWIIAVQETLPVNNSKEE
jgi:hypothetical protein